MNKIKIKISGNFFDKGATNVNDIEYQYSSLIVSDFSFLRGCRGLVERVRGE